ncbi:heat shock 70 kDa protein 4-like [Phragmites australis]|uniref:heat shock 70 kDa protein 4-like n=1 Tax=Phragmites australis TaxID=29695 RepID=UPI002D79052F|nr:heat shock 70 kDa protein 4-like [Phragmites australis]
MRRLLLELFNLKKLRENINPDEAAACGAAIQAAILTRESHRKLLDLVLLDTTPHSLGVETAGGVMTVLIPKNSTVPIKKRQIVSLQNSDEKNGVVISVFQGERCRVRDNDLLGELVLLGVNPKQREGSSSLRCASMPTAMGVLTVSAGYEATGQKNKIITITKDKVGPRHTETLENDEANTKRVAARNMLEGFAYSARRAIEAETKKLDDALLVIDNVIQWMDGDQLAGDRKNQEILEENKRACSPVLRS